MDGKATGVRGATRYDWGLCVAWSQADVDFYIALGAELRARRERVLILATSPVGERAARAHGIESVNLEALGRRLCPRPPTARERREIVDRYGLLSIRDLGIQDLFMHEQSEAT